MKRIRFIYFLALMSVPMLSFPQDVSMETYSWDVTQMNPQAFRGFEMCKISDEFYEVKEGLIAHGKPFKKKGLVWFYTLKSQIMGLPVKAVGIGVCDETGERACGWGAFVAVVITKPLKEPRELLRKKTGIDFTKQKRAEETAVTLRPILAAGETADESVLVCDPGNL